MQCGKTQFLICLNQIYLSLIGYDHRNPLIYKREQNNRRRQQNNTNNNNNNNGSTENFVAAKIVRQMADGVNYTTQNYCMMLFFSRPFVSFSLFLISSSLKCFYIIFAFCLSCFFLLFFSRVQTFDRQKTSGNKVNEYNGTYGDNKYKINLLFSLSNTHTHSRYVCASPSLSFFWMIWFTCN